jgi:hypothetical protein
MQPVSELRDTDGPALRASREFVIVIELGPFEEGEVDDQETA